MKRLFVFVFIFLSSTESDALYKNEVCSTESDEPGRCVLVKNCPKILNLLRKDFISYEEQIYIRESQCGSDGRKALVCCQNPNILNLTKRVDLDSNKDALNLLPTPGECGSSLDDKIFGGRTSKIDEYPWLARLLYKKPLNDYGFHCAGTLINHYYILTAAHCINSIPPSWALHKVRLGEWDTSSEEDCEDELCADPVLDVSVMSFVIHKDYSQENSADYNDIALVHLAKRVNYTFFIKPICLPKNTDAEDLLTPGTEMTIAGWGLTEHGNTSRYKEYAHVPIVNQKDCQKAFESVTVKIKENQICAGGVRGTDSCKGDSGGPLMYHKYEGSNVPYWYAVGIVSFGYEDCGTSGIPGVYTRISSHMKWILSNIDE